MQIEYNDMMLPHRADLFRCWGAGLEINPSDPELGSFDCHLSISEAYVVGTINIMCLLMSYLAMSTLMQDLADRSQDLFDEFSPQLDQR
jgi:hypothetical protein